MPKQPQLSPRPNSLKESKPSHTYARARAHLRRTATRLHGDGNRVGLLLGGPPEHPPEPLPQRVPESPPPIPVAHLPFEALDRRLQLVQAHCHQVAHDASRPRPSPMLQPLLSSHVAVQSESNPIFAMNPVAPLRLDVVVLGAGDAPCQFVKVQRTIGVVFEASAEWPKRPRCHGQRRGPGALQRGYTGGRLGHARLGAGRELL